VIWTIVGIFLFREELKLFFYLKENTQEQKLIFGNEFIGTAHNVFQIEKEGIKGEDDIINTEVVVSEDDFEIEYGLGDFGGSTFDNIIIQGQDQEIDGLVGFQEIQRMVALVDSNEPLSHIEPESIKVTKKTIEQINDTDFLKKMIQTRADISQRIDDILRHI
jgi:hypothetical protein